MENLNTSSQKMRGILERFDKNRANKLRLVRNKKANKKIKDVSPRMDEEGSQSRPQTQTQITNLSNPSSSSSTSSKNSSKLENTSPKKRLSPLKQGKDVPKQLSPQNSVQKDNRNLKKGLPNSKRPISKNDKRVKGKPKKGKGKSRNSSTDDKPRRLNKKKEVASSGDKEEKKKRSQSVNTKTAIDEFKLGNQDYGTEIPYQTFRRLLKQTMDDANAGNQEPFRIQKDALDLLHLECENFLLGLFKSGAILVRKAKRKTIMKRDFGAFLEMQGFKVNKTLY